MERRQVGYVIEDAPEDEVVCTSVHWRSAKEQDCAGDVDPEVVDVVATHFSEDEAGHEERRAAREQEADAPGLGFEDVLPQVEDAGDGEEDCKRD